MSSPASLNEPDESLGELVERLGPKLRRILVHYKVPSQDAEDLLQTAAVSTLRRWETLHEPEAWMVRTLTNQCIAYWRGRRRKLLKESPLEIHGGPSIPSPEDRRVERYDIERRMACLPGSCQRLLRLRVELGFSARETAELLGCPVRRIYNSTYRCIKMLGRDSPPSSPPRESR